MCDAAGRESNHAVIAATLAAAVAATIALQWRRVQGTTLSAALAWAVVASVAFAAVEAVLALTGDAMSPRAASLWRYGAACGTLCPGMAVLGAKRPQDRGWQWVVLSLWAVLLLPAGQLIAAGGGRLQLSGVWQAFLAMIIVAPGPLNYALSRNWFPASLLAAGQVVLLAPYGAPGGEFLGLSEDTAPTLGAAAFLGAVGACITIWDRTTTRLPCPTSAWKQQLAPAESRWIWFRHALGAVWAIRVAYRVNQTAELANWPIRLERDGFVPHEGSDSTTAAALSDEVVAQVNTTLDSLLRRFQRTPPG